MTNPECGLVGVLDQQPITRGGITQHRLDYFNMTWYQENDVCTDPGIN